MEGKRSIFEGLDFTAIAFAATIAFTISILVTIRERNAQRLKGTPLSPFSSVIPDTLLGMIFGTLLALAVPEKFPKMNSFVGVASLAAVGGILGPQVVSLISAHGAEILLDWISGLISKDGALGQWAQKRQQDGTPAPVQPPETPTTTLEHLPREVEDEESGVK